MKAQTPEDNPSAAPDDRFPGLPDRFPLRIPLPRRKWFSVDFMDRYPTNGLNRKQTGSH